MEIWKEVKGTEGKYFASSEGNIKSKRKKLKPCLSSNGYLVVSLSVGGIKMTKNVHKMIAECFLKEKKGRYIVNHKNEIKTDNRVDNLEYVNESENVRFGTSIERMVEKQSIKVLQFNKEGVFVKEWFSACEAGRNGFSQSHICSCCNGNRKSHKGFIWKYEH